MEQMGILRTNCIDCLDRTNVAQFSAGVEALGQQLVVMGIRSSPKLDPSSIIVRMLIDMYVEIGDQIALQYGGSEAHKKVQSSAGGATSNIPGQLGKHKELLTSIRRYYSNAFTDRLKQDAMNLFLGYYIPSNNTTPTNTTTPSNNTTSTPVGSALVSGGLTREQIIGISVGCSVSALGSNFMYYF